MAVSMRWTRPHGHPAAKLDRSDNEPLLLESPPPVDPVSSEDIEQEAAEAATGKPKSPHPDLPDTPFHDARDDQGRFAPKE